MSEFIVNLNYFVISLQVLITLVVVPILSRRMLHRTAMNFGCVAYPEAKNDVHAFLNKASKRYILIVVATFVVCFSIVSHAIATRSELLGWDNQAGLMVLYFLAMIPVLTIALMHNKVFSIFKAYVSSKRSASLRVRKWQEYISGPIFVLIMFANASLIGSVIYFVQYPFDGFAGYINLLGLAVVNIVFTIVIVAVYLDKRTNALQLPEQRDALKKRAIHINMMIAALAIFHLTSSLWIQGTDLQIYKIVAQSLYLQVMLVIPAFFYTLPRALFEQAIQKTETY